MRPVAETAAAARIRAALLAMCIAVAPCAAAHELPRAPRQDFVPPAAGSYQLPVIQQAPSGRVLDIDGFSYPFSRYTRGRVTLLSFMYTYCVDPIGCPLAFETLNTLRERLLARPAIARATRFVSLSFDPTNDTPDAMRRYGGKLAEARSPLRWHFLTTRSVADLEPLLDGLGQDVAVQVNDEGKPTRVFNHMLKLFLLDAKGQVREIYSTAFLMPDMMFNDIETLVLEQRGD